MVSISGAYAWLNDHGLGDASSPSDRLAVTTAAILTTLHITAALAGVCAFTLLAVIVIELTWSRRNRSRR